MKIALLGSGQRLANLAMAAAGRGWLLLGPDGRPLAEAAIERQLLGPQMPGVWESLLAQPSLDAIVIGADQNEPWRGDALRKLAAAGATLLLDFPPCPPLLALELDMIRRDSGSRLLPLGPGWGHPLRDQLREWIRADAAESPIGQIQWLAVDVPLADPDSQQSMDRWIQHCLVIRELVGPIKHVSALRHDATGANGLPRQVTCTAASGLLVRWTIVPPSAGTADTWQLLGTSGSVRLTTSADPDQWELAVDTPSDEPPRRCDWSEAEAALDRLEHVGSQADGSESWAIACHALDIADAALRSARRGRGQDLTESTVTQESTFKGAMAIGGCLILTLCLLVLIAGSVLEGLGTTSGQRSRQLQRQRAARPADQLDSTNRQGTPAPRSVWLRWWPVYPLLVFLLFQLLRGVARSARATSDHGR